MDASAQDRVEGIIRRFARKDKRDIPLAPDTSLFDDLHVNSASRVDIVLELEDAFGISITDEEADTMVTVADILSAVNAKMSQAGATREHTSRP